MTNKLNHFPQSMLKTFNKFSDKTRFKNNILYVALKQ